MSDERSEMLTECLRMVFSAAEIELGAIGYFNFIQRVSAGIAAIKKREDKKRMQRDEEEPEPRPTNQRVTGHSDGERIREAMIAAGVLVPFDKVRPRTDNRPCLSIDE